ncbi:MAG TPA: polyprenyl synthetase family protein [Thermomicrobiales bacterium]|nr:polyprenyl synthetase family protein [Thermomicrobiales bacterium]
MTRGAVARDLDTLLDDVLLESIALGREHAPVFGPNDVPLYDVLAYHLGFANKRFEPRRLDAGKRIRPRLCVLACEAAGGAMSYAIHAAAAIELLHNFTLLHDDIQDQSPLRRHRPTVWRLWGVPQAINAGDAMFSLAHLALNRAVEAGANSSTVLSLSTELHRTTLRIVEGQVLDVGFEARDDVTSGEYLTMVTGKTAAICRYACWAGAMLADASEAARDAFAGFGLALGIGFQLRDDLLGVWGDQAATGKAEADDIRRRKKSLPIIVVWERASATDRTLLRELYAKPELDQSDIARVLQLMAHYEAQAAVQEQVSAWHARALEALSDAHAAEPARTMLLNLVRSMESRRA